MTDVATVPSPKPPKAPVPALPSLRTIDKFEQRRGMWAVKMPPGASAEDLMREEFWRPVAKHLHRHDHVFAINDDESAEFELRIEGVSPDGCEVTVVRTMKRKAVVRRQTALGDGAYHTEYRDGSWHVIRNRDGFSVVSGEATESSATLRWLAGQPQKRN